VIVKCQSKRFESETGCAQKCGEGDGEEADSSVASFMRRRSVGDMIPDDWFHGILDKEEKS